MARESRHDILFEPVRIGPKLLRNRFFQVPHCTGFGTDKPGMQARFRAVKAEGGWAAVCTEICSVHPETDRAPQPLARLWDYDDVRNLAVMCEQVHAFDSLAGVELFHAGPHVDGTLSREALRVRHRAMEGLRFGVQPQMVIEARLGEVVENLWDRRPEPDNPAPHVETLGLERQHTVVTIRHRSRHVDGHAVATPKHQARTPFWA